MRIMIFGDVASGKSTFANMVGERLGLPVTHLDEVMKQVGREDKASIRERITEMVSRERWVIDGNAFTKDEHLRIGAADVIVVFDFARLRTLYNWQRRYWRIRIGREAAAGGQDTRLLAGYYVPYILVNFPKRKRAAMARAAAANKPVTRIKSFNKAKRWLDEHPLFENLKID